MDPTAIRITPSPELRVLSKGTIISLLSQVIATITLPAPTWLCYNPYATQTYSVACADPIKGFNAI